jgi:hypothetical protein
MWTDLSQHQVGNLGIVQLGFDGTREGTLRLGAELSSLSFTGLPPGLFGEELVVKIITKPRGSLPAAMVSSCHGSSWRTCTEAHERSLLQ